MEENLFFEKESKIKQLETESERLAKLIKEKQTSVIVWIILGLFLFLLWILAFIENNKKNELEAKKRLIDKELSTLKKELRETKIELSQSKYTKEQLDQFDLLDSILNKTNKYDNDSDFIKDFINSFKTKPSLTEKLIEINELIEKKIINVSKENFDIWKDMKLTQHY